MDKEVKHALNDLIVFQRYGHVDIIRCGQTWILAPTDGIEFCDGVTVRKTDSFYKLTYVLYGADNQQRDYNLLQSDMMLSHIIQFMEDFND